MINLYKYIIKKLSDVVKDKVMNSLDINNTKLIL